MELRLQQFYENINAIHHEQSKWQIITSSQINEVRNCIDLRLRQIDTELRPEADNIEIELRGIETQFFQPECERNKEKFRLLVAQLEKARRLLIERQIFLGLLQDFRKIIEQTIELGEQARTLPLHADETGERLKKISNDLNDLQDKARTQSDRISEQKRRAEMTVTDFEHSVQKVNEAARAPTTALIGIERIEGLIDEGICNRDIDAVTKLDHSEWKLVKQTIGDLKLSLDTPQLKSLLDNWESAFDDLESNAFNVDAKIVKFNRKNEKEQRLLRNLAAFAEWIDLVEKDLVHVESLADLEPLERQAQLQKLKENCEKHQRLANKLELHKFQSEQQFTFAKEQTSKYRDILDR
uniref:Uncharacterized protein n=1 Tax=Panagrolaimus sp. ES5 TaxID=591445 RepID=A0AC34GCD0_9BILA